MNSLLKNIMMNAFASELEKIANVGAILGGAAGYKLGPDTTKGKLISTLIGAGLGHAVGVAGKAAKREFVDEPHERQMNELYGYQPYVGQLNPQGSNFY